MCFADSRRGPHSSAILLQKKISTPIRFVGLLNVLYSYLGFSSSEETVKSRPKMALIATLKTHRQPSDR
jgi:hypothetical protein